MLSSVLQSPFSGHFSKSILSRELKETLFTITLTDADKKSLEAAQSGPTPNITVNCQMPIKEFILWLEKRNSVHVTYTKNLRIDVVHTSLEKFMYFILLIKYSQGGEMFSFCF